MKLTPFQRLQIRFMWAVMSVLLRALPQVAITPEVLKLEQELRHYAEKDQ